MRAWRKTGWAVYPVHPSASEIEGLQAFASILDIPGEVNTASLYVPPIVGLGIADELIEKRVRQVYLNPGAGSDELKQKLQDAGIEVIEACSIIASELA